MESSVQDFRTVVDPAAATLKPRWEAWMDKEILPETDPIFFADEIKLLEVIRTLIKAPDTDSEAVSQAVAKFQTWFHDEYLDEESHAGWYLRHAADNSCGITYAICCHSWEMASFFPTESITQKKLVDFVVGFKKQSPTSFDQKNPRIPFDDNWASRAARKSWDGFKISKPRGPIYREEPFKVGCNSWLSAAGFMARLLDLGVLGTNEFYMVNRDLEDGLEQSGLPKNSTEEIVMYWQCQATVAAQYILIAGHIIVEEIKRLARREEIPSALETWKAWATALQKIADKDLEYADEWNLKTQAKLAHERMVQLWPVAFGAD